MEKSKFSITRKDEEMLELVTKTDQKTLALWAIDCAERVMPYFEEKYPQDHRPQQAIETLKIWIDTKVFKMAVIRKACPSRADRRPSAHSASEAAWNLDGRGGMRLLQQSSSPRQ